MLLCTCTDMYYRAIVVIYVAVPQCFVVCQGLIEIEMCALEFSKDHSVGVQDRPEDNVVLPSLINELPRVNARTKERPFCAGYATKARILMHAHLTRMALSPQHSEGTYVGILCSSNVRV